MKDLFPTDVTFTDARHGWIVGGEPGFILATSDGGRHWHTQLSGTHDGLNSVSFVNASDGWVVGNGGALYRTHRRRQDVDAQPLACWFGSERGLIRRESTTAGSSRTAWRSWPRPMVARAGRWLSRRLLTPLFVESRPRTFRATEAGHASSPPPPDRPHRGVGRNCSHEAGAQGCRARRTGCTSRSDRPRCAPSRCHNSDDYPNRHHAEDDDPEHEVTARCRWRSDCDLGNRRRPQLQQG